MNRTIHCCWFGRKKTRLALACRASWERFASDWKIREWGEKDLAEMSLPRFAAAAAADRNWAVLSDWMRMRVLYDEGGVYLDCDVELVRQFEPPAGEWVAGEWTASGKVWMNPGSGIALEKGSPVAGRMLEAYASTEYDPKRKMMPWINEQLEKAGGGSLRVLPPNVFSPIDTNGKLHLSDETMAIHHYAMGCAGLGRKSLQWLSWHGFRWLVDLGVWVKRGLKS